MLSLRTVGVVDYIRYIWSRQIGVIAVLMSRQILSASQGQRGQGLERGVELDICLGGSRAIRCLRTRHGYFISHTATAIILMLSSAGMNYISGAIVSHAPKSASNAPQPAIERPICCSRSLHTTRMKNLALHAKCSAHRQRRAAARAALSRWAHPLDSGPINARVN